MLASRVGFLEFIRVAMNETASSTNGYLLRVANLNVTFEQSPVIKEYSEKGIDATVYNLNGTRLSIGFSSPLNDEDEGLYHLIIKCFSQYEERDSVSPTTFSIHTSYYGTLHGCVVESIEIEVEDGGPINVTFQIVARYLDFTTRDIQQLEDGYQNFSSTRNFMFYDVFLDMSPTYVNFNLPTLSDFSKYMKVYNLSINNNMQMNWTLAEQTDIPDTLLPQSLVAPKDITIGGRNVEGSIAYIMPYNDLLGFYKVLQNSTPLELRIFDSFDDSLETYLTIDVNNPIFELPDRPNDIGVLQQTASFIGARSSTDSGFSSAISYSYKYS